MENSKRTRLFIIIQIFYSFCISIVNSEAIITSRYEHYNGLTLKYFIPMIHESGYWRINQQNPYSIIINQGKVNKSGMIYSNNITIDGINYTQILKLETIKMVNFDTTIFYYEIPEKTFPYYDIYDGLTFALHPANESFSILHQLKKEGQISKMVYAFEPKEIRLTEGNLHLGGLPENITKNKYFGKCKVINDSWGCNLRYIYAGDNQNNLFINKYKAIFQSAYGGITAPKEFLDYIAENILKENILRNECEIERNYYSDYIFICKNGKEIFENLPPFLSFVFDNIVLKVPKSQLFYFPSFNGNEKLICNIYLSLNKQEQNIWTFGDRFLSNFITEFDYENKEVTFFSNEAIPIFKKKNNFFRKILIFLIFLLATSSVDLIILKSRSTIY